MEWIPPSLWVYSWTALPSLLCSWCGRVTWLVLDSGVWAKAMSLSAQDHLKHEGAMLFLLSLAWCSQLSRATFANHVLKIEPLGRRGLGSQIANGKDATCGSEITCLDFPWERNQCALGLSHYSCGGLLSWFILAQLRRPFSWDKHSVADRVATHSLSQHTHTHTHTYALYIYMHSHTYSHVYICLCQRTKMTSHTERHSASQGKGVLTVTLQAWLGGGSVWCATVCCHPQPEHTLCQGELPNPALGAQQCEGSEGQNHPGSVRFSGFPCLGSAPEMFSTQFWICNLKQRNIPLDRLHAGLAVLSRVGWRWSGPFRAAPSGRAALPFMMAMGTGAHGTLEPSELGWRATFPLPASLLTHRAAVLRELSEVSLHIIEFCLWVFAQYGNEVLTLRPW